MSRPAPLYAGEPLRRARRDAALTQAAMAARLGVSVSYLSQLECNARPVTASVAATLRRLHPALMAALEEEAPTRRHAALAEALGHPSLVPVGADAIDRLARERPEIADRVVALHAAVRAAEERLLMVEEALAGGTPARMPWEAVRDWFHDAGNFVDPLDRAAEALAGPDEATLVAALAETGIAVVSTDDEAAALRRLAGDRLLLHASLPPESRRFHLAHQLAATRFSGEIAGIVAASGLAEGPARTLLAVGLANYAAGAIVMPYAAFRQAARDTRHDIDRLARRFGVSFEQACHRLSTLQRPGAEGIPFFFCRIDMAGNITKRHSATRLRFARFGGACPLWIVHEAVAIPDRIVVQHAETPDGARYVSMAKGLVKPSGSFARGPRRYAVALGCEAEHARDFVYADAIRASAPPTPIGVSCRLCPRPDCDQRAFPPADRAIAVDPDVRRAVPYRVV